MKIFLKSVLMQDSTYVMAQIAIAFHNMRQVDQAVEYFKQLSEVDPFRYRFLYSIRIRAFVDP